MMVTGLMRSGGVVGQPNRALLLPQLVREAARRQLDIVERDRLVLQDVALQRAAIRETHWQQVLRPGLRAVLHDPVAGETTDTIEPGPGVEVELGECDDIAHRGALRYHGGVVEEHGASDGQRRLERAEVVRAVEGVDGAVTHLVDPHVALVEPRVAVGEYEHPRLGTDDEVDDARAFLEQLLGREQARRLFDPLGLGAGHPRSLTPNPGALAVHAISAIFVPSAKLVMCFGRWNTLAAKPACVSGVRRDP